MLLTGYFPGYTQPFETDLMKYIHILAIMASVLTGCGTYSGRVGFENKCDRDVWVAHVEGFKSEPTVEAISSGLAKYAEVNSTRIPHEVVIHWSYKPNSSEYTTKLVIDASKMPGQDDKLVFRFTDDRKWEVSIMR